MDPSVPSGTDPYIGLVLDEQFRLDELAGSGSMARVYRARQLPLERDVAVKVLRPELLDRPELVTRFQREARIAGKLMHPNVIVVYAVGELPHREASLGREPYVALELLSGPSLAELLASAGGTLPLPRALDIVLSLCDALGEAHARGIVHRDVKPENVMIAQPRAAERDFVKILDFGLAKTLEDESELSTRAGAILGTPRYVSPEGAEGRAVSPASDCYSLATLLYQCLAGRTPFEGDNAVGILVQQATASPPDLRSFEAAQAVPEAIARVIMLNLNKRPEARAKDARQFGRALVLAAQSCGLDAPASRMVATPLSDPPAANQTTRAKTMTGVARPLALFIACFMLGVVAALGVASRLASFSGKFE